MDRQRIGYLVEEAEGRPPAHWLIVGVGGGWTAGYRVTYHGEGSRRRARIREVRIVPGAPGDFVPRGDYALREDDARTAKRRQSLAALGVTVGSFPVPPAFSFEAVRRDLTAKRFTAALAAMSAQLPEEEPWPDSPTSRLDRGRRQGKRRGARRPGRPPKYSPTFYAKFALRYDRTENDDRREAGASTRALLAKHYKVPDSTIGKWIRRAREHGFLTASRQGSRGGFATNTAQQFIERGRK